LFHNLFFVTSESVKAIKKSGYEYLYYPVIFDEEKNEYGQKKIM